jgi:hypothetical protein
MVCNTCKFQGKLKIWRPLYVRKIAPSGLYLFFHSRDIPATQYLALSLPTYNTYKCGRYQSILKGTVSMEHSNFSVGSLLPIKRFSWNPISSVQTQWPTTNVRFVAIGQLWSALYVKTLCLLSCIHYPFRKFSWNSISGTRPKLPTILISFVAIGL